MKNKEEIKIIEPKESCLEEGEVALHETQVKCGKCGHMIRLTIETDYLENE